MTDECMIPLGSAHPGLRCQLLVDFIARLTALQTVGMYNRGAWAMSAAAAFRPNRRFIAPCWLLLGVFRQAGCWMVVCTLANSGAPGNIELWKPYM